MNNDMFFETNLTDLIYFQGEEGDIPNYLTEFRSGGMRGPPGPPVCSFLVFPDFILRAAVPSSNIWQNIH